MGTPCTELHSMISGGSGMASLRVARKTTNSKGNEAKGGRQSGQFHEKYIFSGQNIESDLLRNENEIWFSQF